MAEENINKKKALSKVVNKPIGQLSTSPTKTLAAFSGVATLFRKVLCMTEECLGESKFVA